MSVLAIDREAWRTGAQPGELQWWLAKSPQPPAHDVPWVVEMFRRWGFVPSNFMGQQVLDFGCGPTVMGGFFGGARVTCLDPLAAEYEKIPWSHTRGRPVHAVPGEQFVSELAGRFDLVLSVNALDHAHDLAACIANMVAYARPGGMLLLAVDCHATGCQYHPLQFSALDVAGIFARHPVTLVRHSDNAVDGWHVKPAFGDGVAHLWVYCKAGAT